MIECEVLRTIRGFRPILSAINLAVDHYWNAPSLATDARDGPGGCA
jgi:hypothetical protein